LERFLSPESVARQLSVSNKTVYKWLREKKLKGAKMGHLWRIRPEDLKEFIEQAYEKGTGR